MGVFDSLRNFFGGSSKKEESKQERFDVTQDEVYINGSAVNLYVGPDGEFWFTATQENAKSGKLRRSLIDIKRTLLQDGRHASVEDSSGNIFNIYEARFDDTRDGDAVRFDDLTTVFFEIPRREVVYDRSLLAEVLEKAKECIQQRDDKYINIGQFSRDPFLDIWEFTGKDPRIENLMSKSMIHPRTLAYQQKVDQRNDEYKAELLRQRELQKAAIRRQDEARKRMANDMMKRNIQNPTFEPGRFEYMGDIFRNQYDGTNIYNGSDFSIYVKPFVIRSEGIDKEINHSNVYSLPDGNRRVLYDCNISNKYGFGDMEEHRIFFEVPDMEIPSGKENFFSVRRTDAMLVKDVLLFYDGGKENSATMALLRLLSQKRIYEKGFSGFIGGIYYSNERGYYADCDAKPCSFDVERAIRNTLRNDENRNY